MNKPFICPKCLNTYRTFDDAVYCHDHHDPNATLRQIRTRPIPELRPITSATVKLDKEVWK